VRLVGTYIIARTREEEKTGWVTSSCTEN
jgi:hypothetical protein